MPLGGTLLTIGLGLAATAGLALAYACLGWYVPFVYLNVVFTLGLGAAVGWVYNALARRFRLRSAALTSWLGLALALAAEYLQWTAYLMLVGGHGPDLGLWAALVAQPGQVWGLVRAINADGLWAVLGYTPTGLVLWAVWALEALAIVATFLVYGLNRVGLPYSEAAGRWADELALPTLLQPQPDLPATRAALEAGRFGQVLHPAPAAEAGDFWQLRLFRVPQDAACTYLALDALTRRPGRSGEPVDSSDSLIAFLAITPAQYEALAAQFGAAAPGVRVGG